MKNAFWCRGRAGRLLALVVGLMATVGVAAQSPAAKPVGQGSDAKYIFKAMSDYVSSQKTIEFTFDSDIEVVTPQMEKIQFTNSGDVLVNRPNKLRARRGLVLRRGLGSERRASVSRPESGWARRGLVLRRRFGSERRVWALRRRTEADP